MSIAPGGGQPEAQPGDVRFGRRKFVIGASALVATVVLDACVGGDSSTGSGTATSTMDPRTSLQPSSVQPSTTVLPASVLPASVQPTTVQPATVQPATAPIPSTATTQTMPSAATGPTSVTSTTAVVGGAARFIDHGSPDTDMVALTFHLSGSPHTVSALLDLLEQRSVRVTAFAVGTWITANPEITGRLVANGHELGNHTEHHLDMSTLTARQISDEIVECGRALVPFIGSIGRWFRPSATVVPTQLVLDEAGLAGYAVSVGYDVDSADNTDPGSAAIVSNVTTNAHPGAIVSLHFGHRGTIEALPRILDHLASVRLRPVTVGALLA